MRIEDLMSTPDDTTTAFTLQALRKVRIAQDYLDESLKFKKELDRHSSVDDLIADESLRAGLLTAVGISDKARKYFTSESALLHLREILSMIADDSSTDLRANLLSRYLLTSGDSLGGRSRNLIGREGGDRLIDFLKSSLEKAKVPFEIDSNKVGKVNSISWKSTCVLFDTKPRWIDKNIDVVVLRTKAGVSWNELKEVPEQFLACGEIKGGADPAGSDEHWKTARSAIDRIREAFQLKKMPPPKMFFAGLAIVPGVAREICDNLDSGKLAMAANLARDKQVSELANWITKL